ncbi:Glycosyltransferase, GT2 family [Tessaracoccus bendigoensis DSM 12906]|uniref:Glycosyltransferase, GT2 family n=1 Tax=Tessaracoccus bendigoensis DSM 12906 TaxID=1123357 RepID=A0A1M6MQZ3_9ACTN|nr:glycosyltransferase [Tessaracoccus bendigoensis]SHJ85780.1 Glycosyltransferase, GT2 family [Tessaracoccus bendigoensis DSM 12906]
MNSVNPPPVRLCRRSSFIGSDEPVDVAVIIVTFQSGRTIAELVRTLRESSADLSLRMIVVDNASSDDTADIVRGMGDVIFVESGGNLGYAAGINIGMRFAGAAGSVLILNPDLKVLPGAVSALLARLRVSGAGCVVPAVLDGACRRTESVRREPRLLGAFGDAVFGSRWVARPAALSQIVRSPSAYETPHRIDWATGAAILIDRRVAEEVGAWDERFFLYSEETDFFRRVRESGHEVWFEPAAQVVHMEAGSGRSPELVALTVVNAVRYAEKHRPWSAGPLRLILMLHELRRWRDPTHRVALRALLRKQRWDSLPSADFGDSPAGTAIDHLLVTRFNLPSRGPESLIRAKEGWLQSRVGLFERYTLPSVQSQTNRNFSWLIYLDPQSPEWLLDRLASSMDAGVFQVLFREEVTWEDLAADAEEATGANGGLLITTNLDNDDALSSDFVDRVQRAALHGVRGALYLANGLVSVGDRTYAWHDADNAFCNVIESWYKPQTAWRDWHILLSRHMNSTTIGGAPAWLQIVHDRNVSNRIRGRLTDPTAHRALFPDAFEHASVPSQRSLTVDAYLARPNRETREFVRAVAKGVLLALLGKEGLERFKEKRHAKR